MAETETITINVKRDAAEKFRQMARMRYGRKKGALGRAATEALSEWAEKKGYDPDKHAIEMLRKGFHLGGFKTKDRAKWHER